MVWWLWRCGACLGWYYNFSTAARAQWATEPLAELRHKQTIKQADEDILWIYMDLYDGDVALVGMEYLSAANGLARIVGCCGNEEVVCRNKV